MSAYPDARRVGTTAVEAAIRKIKEPRERKDMNEDRQIGRFTMRQSHFEQVREHMQTVLSIEVTAEVAENFLLKNGPLLGMIVGYGEVETEARHAIWDACDLGFYASQKRNL